LPVRQGEEELLVEVFGKQEGTFLRAGGTQIEALAGKGAKILKAAFRIGALDAGHAFCVVTAGFESLLDIGDTLQAELAVVLGVEGVVGIGESVEMVLEDELESVGDPRDISGVRRGRGCCGEGDHTRKNSRNLIGAWRSSWRGMG